jgi:hypothetical protein
MVSRSPLSQAVATAATTSSIVAGGPDPWPCLPRGGRSHTSVSRTVTPRAHRPRPFSVHEAVDPCSRHAAGRATTRVTLMPESSGHPDERECVPGPGRAIEFDLFNRRRQRIPVRADVQRTHWGDGQGESPSSRMSDEELGVHASPGSAVWTGWVSGAVARSPRRQGCLCLARKVSNRAGTDPTGPHGPGSREARCLMPRGRKANEPDTNVKRSSPISTGNHEAN